VKQIIADARSAKSARGVVIAELTLRRGVERHILKTGCETLLVNLYGG